MAEFTCRINNAGGLEFGDWAANAFRRYRKDNPGMVLKITPLLPESNKQRRFLEGAVIPLATFYQEGLDHQNSDDCHRVREWLKLEFNSEMVRVNGFGNRIAKSTKGRDALQPFLERVIEWLQENYAPPPEAINPEEYKVWHDTIFPYGGADNYIDYLCERRILTSPA